MQKSSDRRRLLKICFVNKNLSLVPYEIWRDFIVCNVDSSTISLLSQTCWGFRELTEDIWNIYLNFAMKKRKEGILDLAVASLKKSAYFGNPIAMFHIGHAFYNDGWTLLENNDEAAIWFKKAAERKNPPAMAHYAYCFKNGDGVEQDLDLCELWGQRALFTKNPYALGYCNYLGLGTEEDPVEALKFFEISGNQGDEYGQLWAGDFYEKGIVELDFEKALFWYKKAAEIGLAEAQCSVGVHLIEGLGCKIDEKEAYIWFQKAANQGNEYALAEILQKK